MKISVIIPVYNGENHIIGCLESILAQTYKDFEIIIVNDASTDNTKKIIENYSPNPAIKVLHNSVNKGQASSINKALKVASGEYIAYLDSDDLMVSNRLEIQSKFLDRNPNVGLVFSDVKYIDRVGDYGKKSLSRDQRKGNALSLRRSLLIVNMIIRSTMMHRRDCKHKVGFFDYKISGSDDYDYCVRISEHYDIKYISRKLIFKVHHGSNISVTRPNGHLYYLKTHIRIVNKVLSRGYNSFPMQALKLSKILRYTISFIFVNNDLAFRLVNRLFFYFDWQLYYFLPSSNN